LGYSISSKVVPGLVHAHLEGNLGRLSRAEAKETSPGMGGWVGQERGDPEEGRHQGLLARILTGGQKGDIQDLGREDAQVFSSSSFFEVSLWFEFNFDFLNFSRLKLK
jgi:hypothetical protein